MTIGQEIKRIRTKSILSQEAFAKEIGVSFTTVNRWENGKTKPSLKAMRKIDAYCRDEGMDVNLGQFLMEDETL